MTRIKDVKITCHICGTEYEGSVLMSSNSMMGAPDIKPLACPKCGAPAKQVHPETHSAATTDILTALLKDKNKAVAILCEYSRNDTDVDEWVKMMKERNLNEWEKSNEDFLKDAETNKMESYAGEFKGQAEKIERLKELSESGNLASKIDEIASEAKKCLEEEKSKYQV